MPSLEQPLHVNVALAVACMPHQKTGPGHLHGHRVASEPSTQHVVTFKQHPEMPHALMRLRELFKMSENSLTKSHLHAGIGAARHRRTQLGLEGKPLSRGTIVVLYHLAACLMQSNRHEMSKSEQTPYLTR